MVNCHERISHCQISIALGKEKVTCPNLDGYQFVLKKSIQAQKQGSPSYERSKEIYY